jgi:hypothetical protein
MVVVAVVVVVANKIATAAFSLRSRLTEYLELAPPTSGQLDKHRTILVAKRTQCSGIDLGTVVAYVPFSSGYSA